MACDACLCSSLQKAGIFNVPEISGGGFLVGISAHRGEDCEISELEQLPEL